MRGEDAHSRPPLAAPSGSPPRAWGRQWEGVEKISGLRFTPTCVGKTHAKDSKGYADAVHPHVRGEDSGDGRPAVTLYRFTPTCVGKTCSVARWFSVLLVHPHVRGEDFSQHTKPAHIPGSPPRAWGRRQTRLSGWMFRTVHPHVRGEDTCCDSIARVIAVHPHVRGEDAFQCRAGCPVRGSSPRAWGRLVDDVPANSDVGSPPRAWGRRAVR